MESKGVVVQETTPSVVQAPPQVIVVQQTPQGGPAAPQGAPPGGMWVEDKYCGTVTCLVALFIFPCVCCCPCDSRMVSNRHLITTPASSKRSFILVVVYNAVSA